MPPTYVEATKLYQKVSGPLRDPLPSGHEVGKMILPDPLDLLRTSSAVNNLSDYREKCWQVSLPRLIFYLPWVYEVNFLLLENFVWVRELALDVTQGRRLL